MDLTLSLTKKFTLNTGNYSSISPSVTLTITDGFKADDLKEVHRLLDILADGLLHEQIESDAKTMAVIKRLGFAEYFKKVKAESNMDEVMEETLRKLTAKAPF